jgi:hypothetical protein
MVDAFDHLPFDHLLPLPTQPLGLNLSFQGFDDDAVAAAGEDDEAKNSTASFDPADPLLHHQPSPASSYSVYSSPPVTMASHDMSSAVVGAAAENASLVADASLHRVLDEQEMAAIYSIGQQHDVEWSDTVNLVTSAWWSKLLESIEGGGGEGTSKPESAGGVEDASSTHTLDWFAGDSLGNQGTTGTGGGDSEVHLREYYGEDVSLPR